MNTQEIHFPGGKRAQAIISPPDADVHDLLRALDIQQPKAVIMIAGGAAQMDKQLHPNLTRLFTDGIAQLAASLDALIIDGGTQAGVMALMGQAVARQRHGPTLLGVTPAGTITYPGKLTDTTSKESAPLDPNHTHFVLVEIDTWGGETAMMYELARAFSEGHPSVAVLINGGAIAKDEVLYNVRQKRPVIVIDGSGRLADEIAGLWREKPLSIADAKMAEIIAHGGMHLFPLTGSSEELVQLVQRLLNRDSISAENERLR